jgi:hypothetical protein
MVKLPLRFLTGVAICLLTFLFTGCTRPTPTPALPLLIITALPPDYTRPIPTTPAPDLIPDLSCDQGSDCAFAYRTDRCCPCGEIYNREQVENTRTLRFVDEPEGHLYRKWRTPRLPCSGVMCAPCFAPPFGLVCDAGTCREVRTWQEILAVCDPDIEKGKWCRITAADTAFQAGERDQAVKICAEASGASSYGMHYSEECLMNLARILKEKDPLASAAFCREHMGAGLSTCLNEAGEALSHSDVEAGLALCREIAIESTNDRGQQDACFHNIAMGVAPKDLEYAKSICEMMSERVEDCKETAAREP